MSYMNICREPLEKYIQCLKSYDTDTCKTLVCKSALINYNDCILGRGEWGEKHKMFEKIESAKSTRTKFSLEMPPYVN